MALSSPQVIGENTQKDKLKKYYCDICCRNCDSANTLADHLLGNKHKRKLQSIRPQEENDAIRLSSFLKAHVKEDPIVGLEYIIERKKDSSYAYSCQLCGLPICHLSIIVGHLMNPSHNKCYIKKHFPYLIPKFSKACTKCEILKSVRDAAIIILKVQGNKKEIQVALPDSDGKTREASEDTPPSKPESGNLSQSILRLLPNQESRESYRYNKMLQKYISNDPPLAKRSRRSPGDQDALPSTALISHYNKSHAIRRDCTATQELEFRTNVEFFEYFANFVISDDEDVLFIRTITQNFIKALTHFPEDDVEGQKTGHQPEASLKDTSRTVHKIPGILEDETQWHL